MAEPSALPTLSALDDVRSFWSEKWSAPKLGWHLDSVNPNLEKYTDLWLGGKADNNIFVPLCGKSVDLAYLALHSRVSHVVGIDIIRDSAEQFAQEHPELSLSEFTLSQRDTASDLGGDDAEQSCTATKECESSRQSYFGGKGITFLIGDLFDIASISDDVQKVHSEHAIPKEKEDKFEAIYDRASMIAIEPSKRHDYISLLGSLLRPGGSILLVTIEKRQVIKEGAKSSGPPFSIDEAHVRKLYEGQEWVQSISLIEERNEIQTDADRERWEARGVSEAYELVFLIRKKQNSD